MRKGFYGFCKAKAFIAPSLKLRHVDEQEKKEDTGHQYIQQS